MLVWSRVESSRGMGLAGERVTREHGSGEPWHRGGGSAEEFVLELGEAYGGLVLW